MVPVPPLPPSHVGVRLDSLTSLRWFAAFGVFLFHMRNMVTFPSQIEWLAADGYLGVTFFFVLSGFVLTWSWRSTTPVRAFYWRRFARIYPLHFLALLVAIPVFYRIVVPDGQWWIKPLDVGILLLSVLVIQGWWQSPEVLFSGNPAAWTLTVEAFFYALHPALLRWLRPLRARGALMTGAIIFGLTVLLRTAMVLWPDSALGHIPEPIMHLPSFGLGMLLAWAYRDGWRLRLPVILPTLVLLAWLFAVARFDLGPVESYLAEIVTLLCGLIIAAAASSDVAGRRGLLVWRPLVALGEWSFAFYLIHATIIYAVMEFAGPQHGSYPRTVLWATVLLAAAIVAAWLMHRFIERPLEKRMRAWQNRRLARRAEAQAVVAR